jgi:hypothetical protein
MSATATLVLAVESVIPADHPVAILAIPLGLLFLSGSVYVLLWSNYGARKAAGIYGVAFFGFNLLLGVFWWFGGPGIPPGLGISNLPGQASDHYNPVWYGFEAGSERAQYFRGVNLLDQFQPVEVRLGVAELTPQERNRDPAFAAQNGSARAAGAVMVEQFLPVDQFGVARIGVTRRTALEETVARVAPAGSRRASPFYTARLDGPVRLLDDPGTGLLLATARLQVVANFTDAEGTPLPPVPVEEPVDWYAFYDPGANWFPSALWTIVSLVLFLVSLAYLDRLEQQEKRRARVVVEEPQDLAVPIAQ